MLRRVGWFQIFLKSPHPPKHNLGAKFSKARQLRDDFSINTPTLHVHAQSHSDIFIVISFRSSYDHHKNCHILPTLSYSWEGSEKRKGSGIFWTKSEDLVQLPTALLQIICNELAIFGPVLPNQNREPPRKIYKPDFFKNCWFRLVSASLGRKFRFPTEVFSSRV